MNIWIQISGVRFKMDKSGRIRWSFSKLRKCDDEMGF